MDIGRLEELGSESGALISLYLNTDDGPSSAVLADLGKRLKAAIDGAPRPVAMSVRADLDRIGGLASRVDTERRPAWAVFAADVDGIFETIPLGAGVSTSVSLGRRPYLRPLRALPDPVSMMVAVVERPRVEVYRHDAAGLVSLGAFEAEPGKDNYGGFRGYEEARVRSRAGEETKAIWKEAGALALAEHQERPFGGLLLTGHRYDLDGFAEMLHAYLRALPIERATIDPHTATSNELVELAVEAGRRVRRGIHEDAIREVLDGAYRGTPIAKGTTAVLRAVNVGAVERLVVCGPFAKPGVRCPECGWLARSGERCESCDVPFDALDDVLGGAWEQVLARGGRVDQVTVASALDVDGVAAVLRFPVDAQAE